MESFILSMMLATSNDGKLYLSGNNTEEYFQVATFLENISFE